MPVSRATRAQLAREAARIRAEHQRAGAPVPAITAQITRELPLSALEAWRLAYGWSRRHVVEAVGEVYRVEGLATPGLTTAMLCRWEHGQARPGPEYIHALAQVYGTMPTRLGLALPAGGLDWYGQRIPQPRQEPQMPSEYPELVAVADSIGLHGADTGAYLAENALDFYAARYSDFPPHILAREVARCRSLLMHHQDTDTRRVLGWLSALLGNLAHHTADPAGALIHLGTAARIGEQVGDARLTGWAVGAQSMVTMSQDRPTDALDLADHAAQYATTPLRRAQVTAWCRLRPLAALGDTAGMAEAIRQARRDMDASADAPGRFGFDQPEFELHVAEAQLAHHPAAAREHATASAGLKRVGSPGWAAAIAVHARAEAAHHQTQDAVGLAENLLDAVPADALRANTVTRLQHLADDLSGQPAARGLTERIRALG
ncbi:helix-turn-helix transcriptional regulator [Lipingzhangella sp. LS1_29]|uniref:Helix-turn-helix transcriptional regulator n=1 Tax=Lipingzhangella rawalii TaxID=2055835 RepID=A0ABU2H8J1_9ACTN|nr:helix-turn-helix transcriptional regulator [Lipingzhangella rawalii]MDS1271617.1 helix-turn-helix transcriptional regulator [Lipingzhangella rawalii]